MIKQENQKSEDVAAVNSLSEELLPHNAVSDD